ncbi:MAG: hypothetical protein RL681_603 [Candidatus Parcubacteria bacterium]|jgi:hypothetical protein
MRARDKHGGETLEGTGNLNMFTKIATTGFDDGDLGGNSTAT